MRLLIAEPPRATARAAPRERTIPTRPALDEVSLSTVDDGRLLTIDWPAPRDDARDPLAQLPATTFVGIPKDPLEGFRILSERRAEHSSLQSGRREQGVRKARPGAPVHDDPATALVHSQALPKMLAANSNHDVLSQAQGQPFQRRSGRPDWRTLMRLDVDDVIATRDCEALQSVLDTLTFSRFDVTEINEVPAGKQSLARSHACPLGELAVVTLRLVSVPARDTPSAAAVVAHCSQYRQVCAPEPAVHRAVDAGSLLSRGSRGCAGATAPAGS